MKQVLLILVLLAISCKSHYSIIEGAKFGFFIVEKTDDEFIYLRKNKNLVSTHGEIENEMPYKLKVPNTLRAINSTVNTIPNEVEFIFDKTQKVFIFENREKIEINNVSLNEEEFLSELKKINATKKIRNFKLKSDAFFGIYSNDTYLIMYLNVRNKNLEIFNEALKSHQVGTTP